MNCARVAVIGILSVLLPAGGVSGQHRLTAAELADKARGMWLGQILGNMAGRATEGDYGATPNPDPCVPWEFCLQWPGDDDTDIEYLALHILEVDGFDCTYPEIAAQWNRHIGTQGIYIANRQAARLIADGVLPPASGSRTYNEHWYAIDAQITTEILGGVSPGLPQQALDLTDKFARISNDGFAVHAAQFYAYMIAQAYVESDVRALIDGGLAVLPESSRTYQVVNDVCKWYDDDMLDGGADWRATRALLYDYYGGGSHSLARYYLWIESAVNTGATVLALLYGEGDFKQTVQIGVLAGWDCDCNPATAGAIIGVIDGFSGLPGDLTDPAYCGDTYVNDYRPGLPDPCAGLPQSETISHIAERIAAVAVDNILANGGSVVFDPCETYLVPVTTAVIGPAALPDPCGPCGLVAAARAAGLDVTPGAAVTRFLTNYDYYNLNTIIDGITDNSHNGHRSYRSVLYSSSPPPLDWYQLAFSAPVRFDEVTFYEGELLWRGINTYYREDDARAGFFEDLTVEIRRNGSYITPAGVQVAPALDRYQIYQPITLSFSPTVGDAVRIIGTAGGTDQYTTILELEAVGAVDPGLYVVETIIANGQAQRSHVGRVEIVFSADVSITAADVTLWAVGGGAAVDPCMIHFGYDGGAHRAELTFDTDGDMIFGDSLPDDGYELQLDCTAITDGPGNYLLDEDAEPGDGVYRQRFHRLYGDTNGDGGVDLVDLSSLAAVFLQGEGESGLELDENNRVDLLELGRLAENWQESCP